MNEEAIEIIEDLLGTISWLGGDSYEMEVAEHSVNRASRLLDKYKPKPEIVFAKAPFDGHLGIYTNKDNAGRIVRAKHRKEASKILGVGKNRLKCIKIPAINGF